MYEFSDEESDPSSPSPLGFSRGGSPDITAPSNDGTVPIPMEELRERGRSGGGNGGGGGRGGSKSRRTKSFTNKFERLAENTRKVREQSIQQSMEVVFPSDIDDAQRAKAEAVAMYNDMIPDQRNPHLINPNNFEKAVRFVKHALSNMLLRGLKVQLTMLKYARCLRTMRTCVRRHLTSRNLQLNRVLRFWLRTMPPMGASAHDMEVMMQVVVFFFKNYNTLRRTRLRKQRFAPGDESLLSTLESLYDRKLFMILGDNDRKARAKMSMMDAIKSTADASSVEHRRVACVELLQRQYLQVLGEYQKQDAFNAFACLDQVQTLRKQFPDLEREEIEDRSAQLVGGKMPDIQEHLVSATFQVVSFGDRQQRVLGKEERRIGPWSVDPDHFRKLRDGRGDALNQAIRNLEKSLQNDADEMGAAQERVADLLDRADSTYFAGKLGGSRRRSSATTNKKFKGAAMAVVGSLSMRNKRKQSDAAPVASGGKPKRLTSQANRRSSAGSTSSRSPSPSPKPFPLDSTRDPGAPKAMKSPTDSNAPLSPSTTCSSTPMFKPQRSASIVKFDLPEGLGDNIEESVMLQNDSFASQQQQNSSQSHNQFGSFPFGDGQSYERKGSTSSLLAVPSFLDTTARPGQQRQQRSSIASSENSDTSPFRESSPKLGKRKSVAFTRSSSMVFNSGDDSNEQSMERSFSRHQTKSLRRKSTRRLKRGSNTSLRFADELDDQEEDVTRETQKARARRSGSLFVADVERVMEEKEAKRQASMSKRAAALVAFIYGGHTPQTEADSKAELRRKLFYHLSPGTKQRSELEADEDEEFIRDTFSGHLTLDEQEAVELRKAYLVALKQRMDEEDEEWRHREGSHRVADIEFDRRLVKDFVRDSVLQQKAGVKAAETKRQAEIDNSVAAKRMDALRERRRAVLTEKSRWRSDHSHITLASTPREEETTTTTTQTREKKAAPIDHDTSVVVPSPARQRSTLLHQATNHHLQQQERQASTSSAKKRQHIDDKNWSTKQYVRGGPQPILNAAKLKIELPAHMRTAEQQKQALIVASNAAVEQNGTDDGGDNAEQLVVDELEDEKDADEDHVLETGGTRGPVPAKIDSAVEKAFDGKGAVDVAFSLDAPPAGTGTVKSVLKAKGTAGHHHQHHHRQHHHSNRHPAPTTIATEPADEGPALAKTRSYSIVHPVITAKSGIGSGLLDGGVEIPSRRTVTTSRVSAVLQSMRYHSKKRSEDALQQLYSGKKDAEVRVTELLDHTCATELLNGTLQQSALAKATGSLAESLRAESAAQITVENVARHQLSHSPSHSMAQSPQQLLSPTSHGAPPSQRGDRMSFSGVMSDNDAGQLLIGSGAGSVTTSFVAGGGSSEDPPRSPVMSLQNNSFGGLQAPSEASNDFSGTFNSVSLPIAAQQVGGRYRQDMSNRVPLFKTEKPPKPTRCASSRGHAFLHSLRIENKNKKGGKISNVSTSAVTVTPPVGNLCPSPSPVVHRPSLDGLPLSAASKSVSFADQQDQEHSAMQLAERFDDDLATTAPKRPQTAAPQEGVDDDFDEFMLEYFARRPASADPTVPFATRF